MSLENKCKEGELQSAASFVHGGLFTLHVLGMYYNIRKGRYIDAAVHAGVATYDLISAIKHSRKSKYLDIDRIRGKL